MKNLLLFIISLLALTSYAQKPENLRFKLSPHLQHLSEKSSDKKQVYTLVVNDLAVFKNYLTDSNLAAALVQEYAPANIAVIRTDPATLLRQILPLASVLFADRSDRIPHEELALSGFDLYLNKVNLVHHFFPDLNGENLTVSVKENRFDETDIDLQGRYLQTPETPTRAATHATTMATILGGAGNSHYTGKGAAGAARLTSANFANLLPDSNYQELGISVQNHSYGLGIENYYGAEAVAYDATVAAESKLLHVFSSGNRGTQASENGLYKGIVNFANLTGTFKMAKNVLVVGAQDSLGAVSVFSSAGPGYDGRLKPELVALGQDGSSGAAALTSGVALLLQQAYQSQFGNLPAAALVKALLINSAVDVGTQGIDFQSGYGSLNAWRALQTLQEKRFLSGTVAQNEVKTFQLKIPENAQNLKVTLVWSDAPAVINAAQALVNDLDLELQHPNGPIWLPWVLNAFPHPDSLRQLPVRKKDHLNNVEQISIENPTPGIYDIRVSGYNISNNFFSFYLVYQWDTTNYLQWTYPTKSDVVEAGTNRILRWETTLETPNTRIEYALDGGNWQTLATDIDLQKGTVNWDAPSTFSKVTLRIVTDNQVFTSDTFVIAKPMDLEVGFNCEESFLLYWNRVPNAAAYQVYELGAQYLEKVATPTDTFSIFNKIENPSRWYAVEPMLADGSAGLRSYATNYTTQGVACYVKNFIANLENEAAVLQLALGTTLGLQKVEFEKWTQGNFIIIKNFNAINKADLQAIDENLRPGVNTYRAKITLADGNITYSEPSQIYYAGSDGYHLFPNPVQSGQPLYLVSKELQGQTVLIFDALGREIQPIILSSEVEDINTGNLPAGVYQIAVFKKENLVHQFKIVVLP